MGGSSFELIMQEVINQQHLMEDLEAENRELHRQLASLREGHGIFVEILGNTFALLGEAVVIPQEVSTSQDSPTVHPLATNFPETPMPTIPETPLPGPDQIAMSDQMVEEVSSSPAPTFLEEALVDEFAAAATSPLAVWSPPDTRPKQQPVDEEEKAALRRELIGSFLLE